MLIRLYDKWVNPDHIINLIPYYDYDDDGQWREKIVATHIEGLNMTIEGKTPDQVASEINKGITK